MKLTISAEELRSWNACQDVLKCFVDFHGENVVPLKYALKSNTVTDFLYIFLENKEHFSERQVKEVKLLLFDYAEHVLHTFESYAAADAAYVKAFKIVNASDAYAYVDAADDAESEREWQKQKLIDLIESWENEKC